MLWNRVNEERVRSLIERMEKLNAERRAKEAQWKIENPHKQCFFIPCAEHTKLMLELCSIPIELPAQIRNSQ